MNQQTPTPIISAQTVSAQTISAQRISAGIISESGTAGASRRLVEVSAGDIDATIAILDALAQFCSSDPAAGRFARLLTQRIHPCEIATLAEALSVTYTQRLTTPTALRTEP